LTTTAIDWVLDVERAFTAAYKHPVAASGPPSLRALAAEGAVASRYLAVGTPRSFSLIGDDPAIAISLEAHRCWFEPRDLRCTNEAVASAIDGRTVSIAEALAADIVCVHAPIALAAAQLRRGTHVNALAPIDIDGELAAQVYDDRSGLTALAAGIIDGRQLDEITIYRASDAAIAMAALTPTDRLL
jgi:hypothetical protein